MVTIVLPSRNRADLLGNDLENRYYATCLNYMEFYIYWPISFIAQTMLLRCFASQPRSKS